MAAFGGGAGSPAAMGAVPGGGSKRPSPSPDLLSADAAKKLRFQSSMRILKDEPVPEGYVRFRSAFKNKNFYSNLAPFSLPIRSDHGPMAPISNISASFPALVNPFDVYELIDELTDDLLIDLGLMKIVSTLTAVTGSTRRTSTACAPTAATVSATRPDSSRYRSC